MDNSEIRTCLLEVKAEIRQLNDEQVLTYYVELGSDRTWNRME